ncbi:single-stranded DNA-binding protein [bacterium]|nr:single-stranded DNA-binding protein [bacterium]MBQ9149346.1 single-stranded DNA-binding protein [bacterium]
MTLAKAFITGVVVKAPEKRFTQNDMPIAGFTINFDPANEGLLRVVAFGQLAETITSTVAMGDNVAVEGKLQVNSYKLPNGKDKKVFEIQANAVEKMSASSNATTPAIASTNENIVSFNQDEIAQDLIDEDEIPF